MSMHEDTLFDKKDNFVLLPGVPTSLGRVSEETVS